MPDGAAEHRAPDHGTNRLVAPEDVGPAVARIVDGSWLPSADRPPLWDGHAGERIAGIVAAWLGMPAGR